MAHKSVLHEQFTAVQKKTFTKYATNLLVGNGYKGINDIVEDLQNGIKLVELMNCLTKKKNETKKSAPVAHIDVPEKNPRNVFQCYANINAALSRIISDGVYLVNIDAEAINAKNEKLILGLIWTLICAYAVDQSNKSIEVAMLDYVNGILKRHHNKFELDPIKNLLDDSIKDGRVFKVLNHNYLNDADRARSSPYEKSPSNAIQHFDQSMKDAENLLRIPALLEAQDMQNVDQKSVVTQLLMYKEKEASLSQEDILKDKLKSKIEAASKARERAKKIDSMADDLIKWINQRSAELLDNKPDMTPEDLKDRSNFVNTHFNQDRPKKYDELNRLLNDVAKFRLECENNDLVAPPIRTAAMKSAWKQMLDNEKITLEYLKKIRAVYEKLFALLRAFERKCGTFRQQSEDMKHSFKKFENLTSKANISTLSDCEIANEVLKGNMSSLHDSFQNCDTYVNQKVKPLSPSQRFLDDRFLSKLEEMRQILDDCQKESNNSDKILEESSERCKKSREILREAAKMLNKLSNETATIAAYCGQIEPFDSLEEFEASKMEEDTYDSMDKMLKEVTDLYRKNADIINDEYDDTKIVNPYTTIKLADIKKKLADLEDPHRNKLKFDKEEYDRLKSKSDIIAKIQVAIDELNSDIDKINSRFDQFNSKSNSSDLDQQIDELRGFHNEVTDLKPAIDRVASKSEKHPELETNLNLLRSNHASAVEGINNSISTLNHAKESAKVGEDVSLTDAEIRAIEKAFANCDSERSGQISFEDYFTCLVSVPLMGVNKISKSSPEITAFFKQYSGNGKTMDVESLKKLYGDCKKNFIVNSKDAVKKMLTSRADEENLIREDQLISLLGEEFVNNLKPNLSPVSKNGNTCYQLSEIL